MTAPASFADIIKEAQDAATRAGLGSADISNPFQRPLPPGHEVVNLPGKAAKPVGPVLEYKAHVEVLNLSESADRYEDVLDQILRGEAVLRSEDKTFTKEGDFVVVITYLVPLTAKKKKEPTDLAHREVDDRDV